jgi:arylsulfatase A-like enzyme
MIRCVLALILLWLAAPAIAAQATAPNIIMILVDDYGWTDVAYAGGNLYETPHIDKLAARGVTFTNAYSACTVCSPTRAALLTGKYPARLHITDWIAGHQRPFARLKPPSWTQYLPREETTIAEAVKARGYATASIGKWHLGTAREGYPDAHGFDVNIAGYERGQPPSYFAPYGIPTLKEGPTGEYLTDREASEACAFIEANKDKPFFIYLPHYTVHTPLQAKKEKIEKYKAKITRLQAAGELGAQRNATYAAMIESLDESVGNIVARLDALKLTDRTIVLLTGDNGGLIGPTDNKPARAGKGSAYDGGVRVPLVVVAPGVAKAGGICDEPVITPDLFATMLELAQVNTDPRGEAKADGLSLVPLLKDPAAKLPRQDIYWHYPHYHPGGATPYSAVRSRDWKLVEFYEDARMELYNLKTDVGETKNLAASQPDKAAELRARLAAWRNAVGAQPPVANPDYDPAKTK